MTTHTFQLGVQQVLKVIGSVIKLASTDTTLPAINSVLLRRQGNYLTATASDRYVIGICRDRFSIMIDAQDLPPEDWRFLLTLDSAKDLLRLARQAVKTKPPVINFEATELELRAGWDAELVAENVEVTTARFPNTDPLLLQMLRRESVVSTCAAVYMQRWGQFVDAQKIADKEIGGSNPSRFWDVSDGGSIAWAVKIGCNADFVGLLMGCRLGDGETVQTVTDVSDWTDLLK